VFLVASLVCNVRAEELFDYLAKPAQGRLVFIHPVGAMMTYMNLSFVAGFVIASPYILYQAYAFLEPAMSPMFRRGILLSAAAAYALFAAGTLFALKVLPIAMQFLLSFSRPGLEAMINVDQYFSFVFLIVFGCGFAFEMPLVMFFLGRGGLVSSATLLAQWRLAIVGCLILGAAVCPTPEMVTWGVVCLTLFMLYVVSIGVVRWAESGRRKRLGLPAPAAGRPS
jgi:sec-independent protein translocase protein TatC